MTGDELLSSFASDAVEYETEGAYAEAAEYYALRAFAGLLVDNFQSQRSIRISFAYTLAAVVCDVRAGQYQRAKQLFDLLKPVYEDAIEATDDPVPVGLLEEWFGDVLLALEDTEAREHYRHAERAYESRPNAGKNWAFEEEFDRAHWAFETLAESEGWTLPDDIEYDFERRIHFKLGLVDGLPGR